MFKGTGAVGHGFWDNLFVHLHVTEYLATFRVIVVLNLDKTTTRRATDRAVVYPSFGEPIDCNVLDRAATDNTASGRAIRVDTR